MHSRLPMRTLALALPWLMTTDSAMAHRAMMRDVRTESHTLPCHTELSASATQTPAITLLGLVTPAVVSGAISVSVVDVQPGASITYCVDGNVVWHADVPHPGLGPLNDHGAALYSIRNLSHSEHRLQAEVTQPDGQHAVSNVILFRSVQDIDQHFSKGLAPYPVLPSVVQTAASVVLHTSSTRAGGDASTQAELVRTRERVAAMYLNFGFDLSFDGNEDISELLPYLLPTGWAQPLALPHRSLSMAFSPDAPFYQPIPAQWPRIPLPTGYIKSFQLNTNHHGDGIGFGISVAPTHSRVQNIVSMWPNQRATLRTISFSVASDWPKDLPTLKSGDRHILFVDPATRTFVSLYKASVAADTHTPQAFYAGPKESFNSLGDRGGSIAARFAELPLLLQPGEATGDTGPIRHALGGPVGRVWAARVYPATARDYGMRDGVDTCTGTGFMNTGLVPYGGVIQLDPAIKLSNLAISRPALRILQAIQTFGYYVMDYGCADLDIYTAISEEELFPYGGLYGTPAGGPGVEKEIADVLLHNTLYVVAPLTKRP